MPDAWCDMTKKQKLAVLAESLQGRQHADQIMARVEKHFRGRDMPRDPNEAMNVVAREQWRALHGDTREWDAFAAQRGVVVR
jgi:hypothetical protein